MYRILELNPQLGTFSGDIDLRMSMYRSTKERLLSAGQTLNDFANGHRYYGFHHVDGGWYYREWAPSADQLYLEGEFNSWNKTSHVYRENRRVTAQTFALKTGRMDTFLQLVKESGRSSWMYLQNISPAGATHSQPVAFALALCETLLLGRGASRVHGGGFAGTVQAFVPLDMVSAFQKGIEENLGKGSCHVLNIRNDGGIRIQ